MVRQAEIQRKFNPRLNPKFSFSRQRVNMYMHPLLFAREK
jgi:hypothetical protein